MDLTQKQNDMKGRVDGLLNRVKPVLLTCLLCGKEEVKDSRHPMGRDCYQRRYINGAADIGVKTGHVPEAFEWLTSLFAKNDGFLQRCQDWLALLEEVLPELQDAYRTAQREVPQMVFQFLGIRTTGNGEPRLNTAQKVAAERKHQEVWTAVGGNTLCWAIRNADAREKLLAQLLEDAPAESNDEPAETDEQSQACSEEQPAQKPSKPRAKKSK